MCANALKYCDDAVPKTQGLWLSQRLRGGSLRGPLHHGRHAAVRLHEDPAPQAVLHPPVAEPRGVRLLWCEYLPKINEEAWISQISPNLAWAGLRPGRAWALGRAGPRMGPGYLISTSAVRQMCFEFVLYE